MYTLNARNDDNDNINKSSREHMVVYRLETDRGLFFFFILVPESINSSRQRDERKKNNNNNNDKVPSVIYYVMIDARITQNVVRAYTRHTKLLQSA